jgi:hypothetical protein
VLVQTNTVPPTFSLLSPSFFPAALAAAASALCVFDLAVLYISFNYSSRSVRIDEKEKEKRKEKLVGFLFKRLWRRMTEFIFQTMIGAPVFFLFRILVDNRTTMTGQRRTIIISSFLLYIFLSLRIFKKISFDSRFFFLLLLLSPSDP